MAGCPLRTSNSGSKPSLIRAEHFAKLFHKRFHILELPVYRCKSHICDGIEFIDLGHDKLSDLLARNLFFISLEDLRFDLIHRFLDLRCAYRTFVAGAQNAAFDLAPVIYFPIVVLFGHHQSRCMYWMSAQESQILRLRIELLSSTGLESMTLVSSLPQ